MIRPAMLLSTHVDDLKGGARRELAQALLQHMNTEVGDCKSEWDEFTHTGVQHTHKAGHHWAHQSQYVGQLRPLNITKHKGKPDAEPVTEADAIAAYRSLLGGVAWLILTRAEAAVYVQSLQRAGATPTYGHLRRINVLLRYITKETSGLTYKTMQHPLKLVGMSDAAFKAQPEDSAGLALRGLAVLLVEADSPRPCSQSGVCHILDFLSRRIRRVVRSTFAAELNAAIDAQESLILLQMVLHEIFCGITPIEDMVSMLEAGALYPPLELCLDAMSVFEAVSAEDVSIPAECSSKAHLICMRDRVQCGMLQALHWTDTQDMVADGLTKGGIDRALLLAASRDGRFILAHESRSIFTPAAASRQGMWKTSSPKPETTKDTAAAC